MELDLSILLKWIRFEHDQCKEWCKGKTANEFRRSLIVKDDQLCFIYVAISSTRKRCVKIVLTIAHTVYLHRKSISLIVYIYK